MPFQVKCPTANCGTTVRIEDAMVAQLQAGQRFQCPKCKTPLAITFPKPAATKEAALPPPSTPAPSPPPTPAPSPPPTPAPSPPPTPAPAPAPTPVPAAPKADVSTGRGGTK